MKRYILLIVGILLSVTIKAQINIKPYEQIAIDYFVKNIIEQEYTEIKYYLFDGNLETSSPLSYSFCMPLSERNDFETTDISKLNIPYDNNELVMGKLGLLKKLFISKKKIANIYVFKHYPKDENVVVVINLSKKSGDDFFSILINSESKKFINYCKKTYYE